VTSPEKTVQVD